MCPRQRTNVLASLNSVKAERSGPPIRSYQCQLPRRLRDSKEAASPILDEFTLGGEQAEADPLLESAFYETGHYKALASNVSQSTYEQSTVSRLASESESPAI